MAATLALTVSGCVSKSKANARAKAAYLAGQKQGQTMEAQQLAVWVAGNVKTHLIPWKEDLTLIKALLQAEYQGVGDPTQIIVTQNGKPPVFVNPKYVLLGKDMPLQAGDRIEVRP